MYEHDPKGMSDLSTRSPDPKKKVITPRVISVIILILIVYALIRHNLSNRGAGNKPAAAYPVGPQMSTFDKTMTYFFGKPIEREGTFVATDTDYWEKYVAHGDYLLVEILTRDVWWQVRYDDSNWQDLYPCNFTRQNRFVEIPASFKSMGIRVKPGQAHNRAKFGFVMIRERDLPKHIGPNFVKEKLGVTEEKAESDL